MFDTVVISNELFGLFKTKEQKDKEAFEKEHEKLVKFVEKYNSFIKRDIKNGNNVSDLFDKIVMLVKNKKPDPALFSKHISVGQYIEKYSETKIVIQDILHLPEALEKLLAHPETAGDENSLIHADIEVVDNEDYDVTYGKAGYPVTFPLDILKMRSQLEHVIKELPALGKKCEEKGHAFIEESLRTANVFESRLLYNTYGKMIYPPLRALVVCSNSLEDILHIAIEIAEHCYK
jgi:hypothetical protein